MIFKRFFHWLSYSGTCSTLSVEEQSRVILTNKILFFQFILSAQFILIFAYFGHYGLSLGIVLVCFLYCISFLFNRFGWHTTSKFLMTFLPIHAIVIYFLFAGTQSGFHYVLIAAAAISAIIYHPRQKKLVCFSIFYPCILFLVLDIWGDHLVIKIMLTGVALTVLKVICSFITLFFILWSIRHYVQQKFQLLDQEHQKQKRITHSLHQVMGELRQKNRLLESYSSKDAYIHVTQGVAHEIKNPMTSLLAGAELLKDRVDDKEAIREFSDLIISTIQRLSSLTKSMLMVDSKITQEANYFSMTTLLQELITLSNFQCKRKKIVLQSDFCKEDKVFGSRVFLAQAFLNLIVNAIQYTDAGGRITIKTTHSKKSGDDGSTASMIISVEDTGQGIDPELRPKIFDAYTSANKESHNVGLGLALVKRVIDEHKGSIQVESELGKGAKFKVFLPLTIDDVVQEDCVSSVLT